MRSAPQGRSRAGPPSPARWRPSGASPVATAPPTWATGRGLRRQGRLSASGCSFPRSPEASFIASRPLLTSALAPVDRPNVGCHRRRRRPVLACPPATTIPARRGLKRCDDRSRSSSPFCSRHWRPWPALPRPPTATSAARATIPASNASPAASSPATTPRTSTGHACRRRRSRTAMRPAICDPKAG